MPERTEFHLSSPIKDVDGKELHALHLRRPRTKDLRVLDKTEGEMSGAIALIAQLAGVQETEIDEMDLADLMPITDWLGKMLPSGGVLGA